MKVKLFIFGVFCFLCSVCNLVDAADYYVAQNGQTPLPPYDSWTNAAVNIQDAVDASVADDTDIVIWVAPGTYRAEPAFADDNVVEITHSLTLRGATDNPSAVKINGDDTYRCLRVNFTKLDGSKVVLENLTFTNGYNAHQGAGVLFRSTRQATGLIANCIISGNRVDGTSTSHGGGGFFSDLAGMAITITNCVIRGNRVDSEEAFAGGIFTHFNFKIYDSEISENQAAKAYGGIYQKGKGTDKSQTVIQNCKIINNTATANVGGVQLATPHTMRNCLIANNTAGSYGGLNISYTAATGEDSLIENCTIAGNHATYRYGAFLIGNDVQLVMNNTIVYYNTAENRFDNFNPGTVLNHEFYNCCSDPLITSGGAPGQGNIITAPAFISLENGDFHLAPNSPCINAGLNLTWMQAAFDLDGFRRLDRFSHTTDIGCFEYLPKGTAITIY